MGTEEIIISDSYQVKNQILPKLPINTSITINNSNSELHNCTGIIIAKEYKYYRIQINEEKIWVPEQWIKIK